MHYQFVAILLVQYNWACQQGNGPDSADADAQPCVRVASADLHTCSLLGHPTHC